MAQYHPAGNADRYPDLTRRITPEEHRDALVAARKAGIHRIDER
jgi:putative pyruvate formate lyase activating enzyme